ncbi:MAG: hypothetical protein WD801_10720 [Gemmatimonadaceae bacterium]
MPNAEQPSPRRRDADAEYSYRRPLALHEMVPAIGIAIGTGLFAFYLMRLLMERTPLRVDRRPRVRGRVTESSVDA